MVDEKGFSDHNAAKYFWSCVLIQIESVSKDGANCNNTDKTQQSKYGDLTPNVFPTMYPLVRTYSRCRNLIGIRRISPKMSSLLLGYGAKVGLPIDEDETLTHFIFQHACTGTLKTFGEKPEIP